jgi:hypothetical protein
MPIFSRSSNDKKRFDQRKKEAVARLDSVPRQVDLPRQREGLGDYISKHRMSDGEVFKYAVVAATNPMTEEEMDNAMASAHKSVKEKPASKEVVGKLDLVGPVSEIKLSDLVTERHKKYKYVAVPFMIVVFDASTSFTKKYWHANVELVDDRMGDQEVIRGVEMNSNVSMRITMGMDFVVRESVLSKLSIRARCGMKNEDVEWGSLTIFPSVKFLMGYALQPYIETKFKPVYSEDHLKEREKDPAFVSACTVQEDLNNLQEMFKAGQIKDESKPAAAAEERECYEGTQFRSGADKSSKNRSAIEKYNKRLEAERSNLYVPVGDDESTTSSKLRAKVVDEEIPDETFSVASGRSRKSNNPFEAYRNSIASPPPTYVPKRSSTYVPFAEFDPTRENIDEAPESSNSSRIREDKGKNREFEGDDPREEKTITFERRRPEFIAKDPEEIVVTVDKPSSNFNPPKFKPRKKKAVAIEEGIEVIS